MPSVEPSGNQPIAVLRHGKGQPQAPEGAFDGALPTALRVLDVNQLSDEHQLPLGKSQSFRHLVAESLKSRVYRRIRTLLDFVQLRTHRRESLLSRGEGGGSRAEPVLRRLLSLGEFLCASVGELQVGAVAGFQQAVVKPERHGNPLIVGCRFGRLLKLLFGAF
jgi:hypothetical protein